MDRSIIRPRVTCVVAESYLLSGAMAPELFSLYRDRANPGHAGSGYVCGQCVMGGSRLAPGLTLMALANRRVLYISYNGMLDPLGQSQVIPYLKELSKLGVRFTLLSYERAQAYGAEGEQRCRSLKQELSQFNIEWHHLRYHQRPSMPATAFDVAAGIRFASRLVRQDRIELVHARAHIPAVIALNLQRRFGIKMIFDVRGLMAEEYIDAGHWRKGSVAARLTKTFQRRALAAADGVVTLTERIWPVISQWNGLR